MICRPNGTEEVIDREEVCKKALAERKVIMRSLTAHKDTLPEYAQLVADLNAQFGTPCQQCDVLGKMSRCARCEVTAYCSRDCQVQDWPRHNSECKKKV